MIYYGFNCKYQQRVWHTVCDQQPGKVVICNVHYVSEMRTLYCCLLLFAVVCVFVQHSHPESYADHVSAVHPWDDPWSLNICRSSIHQSKTVISQMLKCFSMSLPLWRLLVLCSFCWGPADPEAWTKTSWEPMGMQDKSIAKLEKHRETHHNEMNLLTHTHTYIYIYLSLYIYICILYIATYIICIYIYNDE